MSMILLDRKREKEYFLIAMKKQQAMKIAKGLNTQGHGETKTARCPECGSVMTYFRLKTKYYVCRSCGNEWKK